MPDLYHVVTYAGPFGFIKPWTAVRDDLTFSQAFLTPSIVEGMRQKLEVSSILRHRLAHAGLSRQQERTQSAGFRVNSRSRTMSRGSGILTRGILLFPTLHLAFPTEGDAVQAATQHLCLCRNEDLVYPVGEPEPMSLEAFDALDGFELLFGDVAGSVLVGYNRYEEGAPMYGTLQVVGAPTQAEPLVR